MVLSGSMHPRDQAIVAARNMALTDSASEKPVTGIVQVVFDLGIDADCSDAQDFYDSTLDAMRDDFLTAIKGGTPVARVFSSQQEQVAIVFESVDPKDGFLFVTRDTRANNLKVAFLQSITMGLHCKWSEEADIDPRILHRFVDVLFTLPVESIAFRAITQEERGPGA